MVDNWWREKRIISEVIGVFTQDKEFQDWWVSKKIKLPFFDNDK